MAETIEYDTWLRELVADSDHPFVRDSEAMIQYLFELDRKLPSKYGWRVTSVEVFKEQVARGSSANDLNRLYWHDMARNIEAYGVMLTWRATEFIKAALRPLNAREILAPAVLSRSLLELGASIIVNSNKIQKTVRESLKGTQGNVVVSTELEELVVRMIWGTRVSKSPDYPKAIDTREYRQFVSKNQNASEFSSVYAYLCELTHPNALWNARFWAVVESKNEDGSETLRMERYAESTTTTEIREKILWALGWSAVCVRNGFEIGQDVVRMVVERWPK